MHSASVHSTNSGGCMNEQRVQTPPHTPGAARYVGAAARPANDVHGSDATPRAHPRPKNGASVAPFHRDRSSSAITKAWEEMGRGRVRTPHWRRCCA